MENTRINPQEEVEDNREKREATVSEVLDTLKRLGGANREHRIENADKWLEDRTASLPGPARREIHEYDAWLQTLADKGSTLPDEARSRILDRDISRIESSFVDRRFSLDNGEMMMNERYGKEKTKEYIDKILSNRELQEGDLDRIARLSFDANGLKAVNDLSASHERGTEYLKRIAEAIADPNGQAAKLLKEAGVKEIIPVTGGGDEYSVLVYGDQPLDPDKLGEAVAAYESAVAAIDTSDLVDFKDLDTRLRFLGVSRKDYDRMGADAKKEVESKFRQDIPEGFKMSARVSGGVETLAQGIATAIKDERDTKRLTGKETHYQEALAKTMGGLWDAADAAMEVHKSDYKAGLEAPGASPEDRAYSQIFSRNKAEREARKKSERMEQEAGRAGDYDRLVEMMDGELAKLEQIKDDIGQEAFDRAEQQIDRKYRQMLRDLRKKNQGQ